MHIHGANLNANAGPHGARASESALAARRAEETRKKLFAGSAEMDALSGADSPWAVSLVGAWGGAGSGAGTNPRNAQSAPSEEAIEEVPRTPATGPVSYWA